MKRHSPDDGLLAPDTPVPCYSEIERYLSYYSAARETGAGELALFALPGQLCFTHADARAIAEKAVSLARARAHVYLHIHLHKLPQGESHRHRGNSQSMRSAIGLFSDIDARGPGRSKAPEILCPTQEDAVWVAEECGKRHGITPSFIITSGHGCYPAVLFREPLVIGVPDDLARLEALGRRFHNALHAVACERGWTGAVEYCGHAKVLRLPGCVNWKDPADPRPVCLTRETGSRFSLEELEDALTANGPQSMFAVSALAVPARNAEPRPEPMQQGATADFSLVAKDDFVSKVIAHLLQENDPTFVTLWNYERGFPSCSEYDMALASWGVGSGLGDEQIAALIVENRRRYPRPKQDRKGTHYTDYLRRTIAKARASQRQKSVLIQEEVKLGPLDDNENETVECGERDADVDASEPTKAKENDDPRSALQEPPADPALPATETDKQPPESEIARPDPSAEGSKDATVAAAVADPETQPVPPRPEDGLSKKLADRLMAKHHFAHDAGERLYIHQGGLYVAGNLRVRQQVQAILERSGKSGAWSSHRGREVVQYLMLRSPEFWEQPPYDEVNLLNGILNIWSGDLRKHDPAFLSPIQIPVIYDPGATCPAWEKFVGEVFPEDSRELAWEIVGDLITPDRSIQKAILLTGEGGNGKGVFLAACLAFVGRKNVSTLPLHKLEEDRFSASGLYGKLVNCCPDLPSDQLKSTSVFKSITGCDMIPIERKYENSFDFKPYARLLFSANHLPRSNDASKAFFDRWLVVPFDQAIRGTERDRSRREMDAMLADPKELSGVLNKALPALRRVRCSQRFTETKSTRKALAEFQAITDPLTVWLEREMVTHPNALVPCAALLQAYNADAVRHQRPPLSQTAFGAAVRRWRPSVEVRKRGPKGEQKDHYIGIGLRTDADLSQGGMSAVGPVVPVVPVSLSVSSSYSLGTVKQRRVERDE